MVPSAPAPAFPDGLDAPAIDAVSRPSPDPDLLSTSDWEALPSAPGLRKGDFEPSPEAGSGNEFGGELKPASTENETISSSPFDPSIPRRRAITGPGVRGTTCTSAGMARE